MAVWQHNDRPNIINVSSLYGEKVKVQVETVDRHSVLISLSVGPLSGLRKKADDPGVAVALRANDVAQIIRALQEALRNPFGEAA